LPTPENDRDNDPLKTAKGPAEIAKELALLV
jgi:hypothetical protein